MNVIEQTNASHSQMWRRISALGFAYSVLYVVGVLALGGTPPGLGAGPGALSSYYTSHRTSITASVFVVAVAMVVFAFFCVALRRALARPGTDAGYLSAVASVGSAVYIGGFLLGCVLEFALVDGARHHQAATLQVVNTMAQDDFIPVVCGLAIVALATGVTALRFGSLPRWLAWASIGLGVLALAGPFGAIAFLLTPVWSLAVAIVMVRRRNQVSEMPAPIASRPVHS